MLSQHTFRDGTTITNRTDTNPKLYVSIKQGLEKPLQIAESTLELSNGKSVTHLHCDGWIDRSPISDEETLQHLLDRAEELSPEKDIPVAFNCKGGKGRTGTAYLCYYLRRYIQERLAAGDRLDDITINIPKLLYNSWKERSGLTSHGDQLTQVYSVTAAYYNRLKMIESLQTFEPIPKSDS